MYAGGGGLGSDAKWGSLNTQAFVGQGGSQGTGVSNDMPLSGCWDTGGALCAGGSWALWEKRRKGLGWQSGHCDCHGSPETEQIGSTWRDHSKELAHTVVEADKSQDLWGEWASWGPRQADEELQSAPESLRTRRVAGGSSSPGANASMPV